ncbi:MAG: PH domain-containing protein [Myxococcota bacterium]
MSYVSRSSSRDEKVVHRARYPFVYHLVSWLWLLLLGVFVVGIIAFFQREIEAWTTEMTVTTKRLVLKRGLFNVHTEELPLDTVEEINVQRSFWGQIFNYGRISVAGTGAGGIEFPPSQGPLRFRSAILEARADHVSRQLRSVHPA